jgi:OHCU decarboxylase
MTNSLDAVNALGHAAAEADFLACGGASRWAKSMAARRPFRNDQQLFQVADELWRELGPNDWIEAFSRHPKIGQKAQPQNDAATKLQGTGTEDSGATRQWSSQEQSGMQSASTDVATRLALGNEAYWDRFGFIFIVCATGKTAEQMLAILEQRLQNDRAIELSVAAEELRQIMQIRLRKLLEARVK